MLGVGKQGWKSCRESWDIHTFKAVEAKRDNIIAIYGMCMYLGLFCLFGMYLNIVQYAMQNIGEKNHYLVTIILSPVLHICNFIM